MSEDAEFAFFSKCSAVVLDVAGTTTSIEFVKGTLFPFAEKNCEEYLKDNFENEDVKKALKLLKDDVPDVAAAVATFKKLSVECSENEGVKIIQGLIYKQGYASDKLKAHIFSDVPSALESWAKTMKVAIYSTGSIDSQKLLFAHTTDGDITTHITHYFDQTNIGPKTEKDSYEKIAKELNLTPEEMVFVSDDVKELKAAKEAKLFTVFIKREGNDAVPEDEEKQHSVVATFADLISTGKRKCPVDETPEIKEPPTKVAKTDQEIAAPEESTLAGKKDDDERMEVDSTTESKEEVSGATKVDEKVVLEAEVEEAEVKEDTKVDTNDEIKEKIIDAPAKEDNDKEGEITSTNEEDKKSSDNNAASQTEEEKVVTENLSKESSVVDSTDATVEAPATVEKSADELKVPAEEIAVDAAADKEKTVEAKDESEKTDKTLLKDENAKNAKVEESKKDQEKETEETKTVEEVVPSSNGDSKHEKTDETVQEKEAIEGADSATSAPVAETTNGEAVKVVEKENKSDLANGKAENGDTVKEETKKTDDEKTSEDIKVKKIEDASDAAAPVSVET